MWGDWDDDVYLQLDDGGGLLASWRCGDLSSNTEDGALVLVGPYRKAITDSPPTTVPVPLAYQMHDNSELHHLLLLAASQTQHFNTPKSPKTSNTPATAAALHTRCHEALALRR